MTLTIGTGVNVTSVSWILSGPNSYSGNANIGNAQSLEFEVGGILAGGPYTVTLSGTDSQGDPCSGTSTPFNVFAGATTYTMVSVICLEPTDATLSPDITTGSVAVEAGVSVVVNPPFQCGGISSFSISPAEVGVGQTSALTISTVGPVSAITWSVSPSTLDAGAGNIGAGVDGGASITNPGSANASFTCTVPGQYVVTASIAPCTGQQFTTISGLINCEPSCLTASDCPGMSTACMPISCTGGLCSTQTAPEGTPCADAGVSQICNGIGSCVPFTFDVVRVGAADGGTLLARSTSVFVEQRNITDGGLVSTVSLPTAAAGANQPFTEPGLALGVGLSRSVDSRYLTLAGYAVAPGSIDPTITAADSIVVARIDDAGNVNTSTLAQGAFQTSNSIRTAVSADGTQFWLGGAGGTGSGGIWYVPLGTVDAGVQLNSATVRSLGIFNSPSQLYATGEVDAAMPLVGMVGSGLPTSGTQTITTVNGLPASVTSSMASPWSFVFLDMQASVPGLDTLYVASELIGDSGIMQGIERWTSNGVTWSQTATLTLAQQEAGAPVGFRGLTGVKVGSTAILIGTTAETGNRIAVFTDDAVSNPWAGTVNVVATAATANKMFFRGVALPPH